MLFLRVLAMPGVCAYAPAGSCMGRTHSVQSGQPGLCLYCPGIGIGRERGGLRDSYVFTLFMRLGYCKMAAGPGFRIA